MSSDASWKGMASTSLLSILTTLFMDGYLSPVVPDASCQTNPANSPNRKKESPSARSSCGSASLYVERTAVRQPPFLSPAPQPPRHCDTTSCVGVGSLKTGFGRVKK